MLKRFPSIADILPVYALISSLFYGWSVVVFAWKLPGWLFFLTSGEIAVIFSYEFVTNLSESLFVMVPLILLAGILPPRVLKEAFVSRGSAIALGMIGSMMIVVRLSVANKLGPPAYWPAWLLGAVLVSIMLAWITSRVIFVARALAWLADRLIVFLLILIPLSVVALIVVLARFLS